MNIMRLAIGLVLIGVSAAHGQSGNFRSYSPNPYYPSTQYRAPRRDVGPLPLLPTLPERAPFPRQYQNDQLDVPTMRQNQERKPEAQRPNRKSEENEPAEKKQQEHEEKTEEKEKEEPEEAEEPEEEEKEEEEGIQLRGVFEDGFTLETKDKDYQLRIRLMEQTDFRWFLPNDQEPARTGLYIPRFRAYFEGRLTRPFEYELSIQRSVEGTFDVLDANLNFKFCEPFQIKFGRFVVPYSYTWYDHLEQYFITPERGLYPLNFGLSRQAGVMAHGKLQDGRIQYAVGMFSGQIIGVADTNETRDGVAYFNFRPFLHSYNYPILRGLNVGVSGSVGRQTTPSESLPLRTAIQSSENDEAAQSASAQFLEFNEDVVLFGERTQGAVHLSWYYQQLSFETEFQAGRIEYARKEHPGVTGIPVYGFHFTLGYFLTGEVIEGRGPVTPLRPFDPMHGFYGPGAFEVFARYSQLRLSPRVFEAELANPEEWTNDAQIIDVGVNWYLNNFVKFYLDWQHTIHGSPVLVNPETEQFSINNDLVWLRCQVYF
ncbi:MAG: OprO/OprP family phosphate-selective porin [Gemmataceae bacterium]